MDVGMSIASTIQEIYETDKTLSMKRLFVSGINVGRDMMGTMTNTLIFAYVIGTVNTTPRLPDNPCMISIPIT